MVLTLLLLCGWQESEATPANISGDWSRLGKGRNRKERGGEGRKTQEETSCIPSILCQWKCTNGASWSTSNRNCFFLNQRTPTPSGSHKIKTKILCLAIKTQAHWGRVYLLTRLVYPKPIVLLLPHTHHADYGLYIIFVSAALTTPNSLSLHPSFFQLLL